jgi:biotin carboxylase
MLPSAQADLINILEYITRESGSLNIGRRFVGALRQQCREFAALPGTLGRARRRCIKSRSTCSKGQIRVPKNQLQSVVRARDGNNVAETITYHFQEVSGTLD